MKKISDEIQKKLREKLPEEPSLLSDVESTFKRYDNYIAQLEEAVKKLRLGKFAPKSEKLSPPENQQSLFNEVEELTTQNPENLEFPIEEIEDSITVPEHKRKRGKRKPLPADLPREEVIIDLPETEKVCAHDGTALKLIGEEVSEKLEVIPMQMKVIRTIRKKYACNECDRGLKTAALPPSPIPKSIATSGLLAFIAVSKYQDALPLYRLENIFERYGIELSRETMAHWMIKTANLLRPLYNFLQDDLLESDYLHADETTVQVLKEEGRDPTSKSYMWVRARSYEKPIILFHYEPSRAGSVPLEILEGFKGRLQVDAYGGYNRISNKSGIIRHGCFAHARRKFYEAMKVSKVGSNICVQFLKMYQKLTDIEVHAKSFTPELRYEYRLKYAVPILDKIKKFAEEKVNNVPQSLATGQALNYLLNEWPTLIRYIEDGRCKIDNNFIENSIRPFALGRKNWLFSDTVDGAEASSIIYSVIETAKANGREPYQYLRQILTELPKAETVENFEALLPF